MVLTRQGRHVSSSVLPFLPLFLRAPVVQGKRRGGKELGIPTGEINFLTPCLQTLEQFYTAPVCTYSLGL